MSEAEASAFLRAAIQRACPLIAAVDNGQRTIPVGGVGLPR